MGRGDRGEVWGSLRFGAGTSKPTVVLYEVVPEVAEGAVALHAADLVALEDVVLHGVLAVHGGDRLVRALVVCRMSRVTALGPPVKADGLGVSNGVVADSPAVAAAGTQRPGLRVVVVLREPEVGYPLCSKSAV